MDFDQDSFQKHIDDTLIAGDGLCNKHIVEIVVKEGVERIKKLLNGEQDLIKKLMVIINWKRRRA